METNKAQGNYTQCPFLRDKICHNLGDKSRLNIKAKGYTDDCENQGTLTIWFSLSLCAIEESFKYKGQST